MTINPNAPEMPPGEDSWTDLAQNLFGIEFNNPPDADELISDEDLDIDVDEPTGIPEATASAEPAPAEPEQPLAQPADEVDAGNEVHAEITEVDVIATVAGESIEIATTDGPADLPEPSVSEPLAEEEEDGYWDALESWNWSEEPEETRASSSRSGRSRTSRRAPRQERTPSRKSAPSRSSAPPKESPSAPAPVASSDEYLDDSGFGAGILDDSPVDAPASSASVAETAGQPVSASNEPAANEGDRPPRKRRRRRRRRPRRTEGELTESVSESCSTEESPSPEESLLPEESSGETPEGEPVVTTSTNQTEKPASRRRSSRRRRGSHGSKSDAAKTPHDETPDEVADAAETEQPPADDKQPTSSKRKPASYKDIPTWEEALSHLLQANQAPSRKPESASGSSGTAKRDSPKRTGRRRRSRS